MSKEEMREGFEAWHCEQYKTKYMTGAPTRDMRNGVRDENYCSKKSQALWECWQSTVGDVAKVEALKEEIERIEAGKQPVAWIKPDVLATLRKDECCYAFGEQSPKGNLVPLFTRSDAGEVDRLSTVVEQQKNLIASLRAELTESYSIDGAKQRNAQLSSTLEECITEMSLALQDHAVRSAMTVVGRTRFLKLVQDYNTQPTESGASA